MNGAIDRGVGNGEFNSSATVIEIKSKNWREERVGIKERIFRELKRPIGTAHSNGISKIKCQPNSTYCAFASSSFPSFPLHGYVRHNMFFGEELYKDRRREGWEAILGTHLHSCTQPFPGSSSLCALPRPQWAGLFCSLLTF